VQTLAVKAERARRKYELLVEGWKESKHLLGALEFILPKPPLLQHDILSTLYALISARLVWATSPNRHANPQPAFAISA